MADTIFSIFPDSRPAPGGSLKGKPLRSKKQALCDVKNTLQSKRVNGKEPIRKFESDGVCKDSVKEFPVQKTPAKMTSQLQGTFKIASDEKENMEFWDPCQCCQNIGEDQFGVRPPGTFLDDADFKYLAKGIFSLELDSYEHSPEPFLVPSLDNWLDIELDVPDIPIPSIDLELEEIGISDEE